MTDFVGRVYRRIAADSNKAILVARSQIRSHLGFKAGLILALPESHRLLVIENATVRRIAAKLVFGAIGNISQMAEHGSLVAFFDLAVQLGVATDRLKEVFIVHVILAFALDGLHFLALGVV